MARKSFEYKWEVERYKEEHKEIEMTIYQSEGRFIIEAIIKEEE